MLAAGHGNVVTISSVDAFLPDPAVADHSAAKAALTNFSKALSKEVGARRRPVWPTGHPTTKRTAEAIKRCCRRRTALLTSARRCGNRRSAPSKRRGHRAPRK
ncbi:SDR family NAD(P)-dependent oxidoreductase [Nonomuraea sp. CA-143628]|uniref:SDR family NAD(P)-dependent oxidoreductase n=1 Tax=Nonomuraea sp. CA-143628 TaxID=3239997 RepID=UPI003D8C3A30